MLPLLFVSCVKESPVIDQNDNPTNNQNEDKEIIEYYVKYEAWTGHGNVALEGLQFRNEKGEMVRVQDYDAGSHFEIIIGPVLYGFNCKISTTGDPYYGHLRIECCKNNSPFAYKASGNGNVEFTIKY